MDILIWSIIFIIALAVMVVGAEMFLKNAELVGARMGMSSFVIGAIIVGLGTSLPELTSSLLALLANEPTIVASNAIGSNIANILLVGGVLAFVGKHMVIGKNLLDAELPFFVISTALFAEIAFDGQITFIESVLLASTFVVYMIFLFSKEYESGSVVEAVSEEVQHERFTFFKLHELRSVLMMVGGLVALLIGAKFVIDAVIELATIMSVPPSVISISAIAFGTSLPELVVSVKALQLKKLEVAIGNIFGSNAFNILMAVGIPGLFSTLPLDTPTLTIGLPVLLVSSFIFLVIGLAHKIYRWEGIMFFLLYVFFILQIIDFCCVA